MEKRQQWGSKLGFLLAAVGSAVGLGNFWKFPYVMGQGGGALFLIIYLLCIILVGVPVLVAELMIGKRNQKNAVASLKSEFPERPFFIGGWLGFITAFLILSFYTVIAGWCMYYTIASLTGKLAFASQSQSVDHFLSFTTGNYLPLVFLILFIVLNVGVLLGGVKEGIEKAAKILMPILVAIVFLLIIRALTLGDGVKEGLAFMFKPDFSAITPNLVLTALGLAFFKLSLGMGTMITYGSYLKPESNVVKSSFQIAFFDTLIAVLAGLAIFPTVFAMGFDVSSGPSLAFITIPALLNQLPFGQVFGVLFFFALTVAALTSSISIYEVIIAFLSEEFKKSRKYVIIVSSVIITVLGILVSVSFTDVIPGVQYDLLDSLDLLTSVFFMPLGGLIIVLGAGWALKRSTFLDELGNNIFNKILYVFVVMAPFIISFIFVLGVVDFLSKY